MYDLLRDPLTGLPNLFGLMECNLEKTFGADGIMLSIDMKHLSHVNRDFGREKGDVYFRELADVLYQIVLLPHPDTPIFRTGGDFFVLRFPAGSRENVESLAQKIDRSLEMRMEAHGITGKGIHAGIHEYGEPFASVSGLMKCCNISLYQIIQEEQIDPSLPRWAEYLISDTFNRVRETLQLLKANHALAHSDDVSGLPNHRAAQIHLLELQEKHRRALGHRQDDSQGYGILFIDGDNLKRYNNEGYQQGNQMIRGLAGMLASCLREGDGIYRWLSGDEFLVVLGNTGQCACAEIAERLRLQVETGTGDWIYPITVSIGIAHAPEDGENPDDILSVAERRNADAKRQGKNRIVASDTRSAYSL